MEEIERLCSNRQKVLAGHEAGVLSVCWNSTGSILASGASDSLVKLWSVDSSGQNREIRELKGHSKAIEEVTWIQNDDSVVVSASEDKTVKFWDAMSGKCLQTIQTRGANLSCASSPDGSQVVVGDKNDNLTLIDVRKMQIMDSANFQDLLGAQVNEVRWTKCGSHLCLTTLFPSTDKGGVEFVDTRKGTFQRVLSLTAHTANCFCIDFDRTGRYFALGGSDALVSLWDAKELICVNSFSRSDGPIRATSFSYDGKILAYGSTDKFIYLDDVETTEPVGTVDVSVVTAVRDLAWHPNQHILAYCGSENKGTHGGFVRLAGANFD